MNIKLLTRQCSVKIKPTKGLKNRKETIPNSTPQSAVQSSKLCKIQNNTETVYSASNIKVLQFFEITMYQNVSTGDSTKDGGAVLLTTAKFVK